MSPPEGPAYASGSRALVIALVVGLVGVLIGRAIWGGGEKDVRPAITASSATAQTTPAPPVRPKNPVDAVLADTAPGLQSCLQKVSGAPAPAAPRQVTNKQQFIAILSLQLQRLRDLRFRHPVNAEFLSGPQISKRVGELVDKHPPPAQLAAAQDRLLAVVGAVKPGTDTQKIQKEALQGQVAGLYVPETGELLVRAKRKQLGVIDTITIVHEMDHALTDQRLGIRDKLGQGDTSDERSVAYSALVEGDATIAMYAYLLKHGGLNDQLEATSAVGQAASAEKSLAAAPVYFQLQLIFPYFAGLNFDCHLYERGGWKAVDRAYAKPPRTSAEILFPDRYGEHMKELAPLPRLGKPWKRQLQTSVGAADLYFLFSAPGNQTDKALPNPLGAASNWNGGRTDLWTHGKQTAASIAVRSRRPGPALCTAFQRWYGAFGGDSSVSGSGDQRTVEYEGGPAGHGVLRCTPGGVRLGLGPNAAVASRLAG